MALAQTLNGVKRELKTKGYLNQLKRQEMVPGIVYGNGQDPKPVAIQGRQIQKVFTQYGSRGLFFLNLEEETSPITVLVRELQRHPITGKLVHVDFLAVNMSEKITSTVGIQIIGEEEVVKKEGILQLGAKEVEVSCLPGDLPEYFTCDVSALEIGDKISVGDINVPAEVEVISDPETLIVTVLAPTMATADEPEEENLESEGQDQAEVSQSEEE
ncbi:50S ribosomal protein L25 [Syntrophomonas erecta]